MREYSCVKRVGECQCGNTGRRGVGGGGDPAPMSLFPAAAHLIQFHIRTGMSTLKTKHIQLDAEYASVQIKSNLCLN